MRVLHVQRTDGVSGSERHLLALLPALRASGVDARAVVLERPGGERFTEALEAVGVPAEGHAVSADVSPAAVAAMVRRLRQDRSTILHTHLVHADVLGAVAAAIVRAPRVSSVHSTAAHYRREPVRSAARLAGQRADRVIAISEHVGRFVTQERMVRPGRLRVVHYGIDLEAWTPLADVSGARGRAGWADDEVVALVASRLVPDKGHDVALRALARAVEQVPRLRLVVAGDGPLRADIESLVGELGLDGHVTLLGYVSNLRELMGACDVVLFPTGAGFGEGFGLVNLEAMALGRPIVGSAVASVPEIVDDGVTGRLVPPDLVDPLAQALLELAADPAVRRRMGAVARERAVERFSLDQMVERTLAVYREVAAG